MMVIQVILIVLVVVIMALFLRPSSRIRALTTITAIIFAGFAIAAVLFPEAVTWVANLIGIGRGTDLLLYCLTVIVIFTLIKDSIARRRDQQRFARLVRQVALLQAPAVPSVEETD
ncbi:MAG: DUF2304 domain-containing protein [Propionibacteriaceae bacterium]|jgi:hypothetical protein|nr:DUF2304 domain-containing protein [Propionibacteriaceae bacterium]